MFNVGDTAILKPASIYATGVLITPTDVTILARARETSTDAFAWLAQNYIDWGTGCFIPKAVKIAKEPFGGYCAGWRAILPIDSLPRQCIWWIPVSTLLREPPITCTRRLTVKQFN